MRIKKEKNEKRKREKSRLIRLSLSLSLSLSHPVRPFRLLSHINPQTLFKTYSAARCSLSARREKRVERKENEREDRDRSIKRKRK
jgi:hypothetical protein